jgi:hypothetical protein
MNFAPYLTYSGMGFSQLKNQPLAALAPADYERMFDSKEDWDALQRQMDSYFDSKIDMFEYRLVEKAAPARLTLRGVLNRLFFRVEHPSRYFELEDNLIGRRFPGGMGTTPGEEDLRSLVSALRHLFAHNLARFIVYKRASAIAFSLMAIGVLAGVAIAGLPLYVFPAANAALLLIFFVVNDWIILKYYLSALNESCLFVNNEASRRTKNLSNLFDALWPKIDVEREKLQFERRLHDWPERAARWMTLIYWVAKRLEYIERHVHVEIWRMRRIHYWLNRASLIVAIVALFVPLAVLWSVWLLLPDRAQPMMVLGLVLTHALILTYALSSYLFWNTPIDLLEQTLQTDNWNRYRSIRVHTKISEQIFRDKQKIIDLDWTAANAPGRNGPNNPATRLR